MAESTRERSITKTLFGIIAVGLIVSVGACDSEPLPVEESVEPYRLVSYGLWRNDYDWPQRRENFVSALREARPDVLCLQDVVHTEEENQASQIADSLGYQWTFASTDTTDTRIGVAILARDSLGSTAEHAIGDSLSIAPVASAEIELNGHSISFYCTALEPVDTDSAAVHRQAQVDSLTELLETGRRAPPLIVMGNFFAEPGAPELASIRDILVDPFDDMMDSGDRPSTQNPYVGHRPRWTSYILLSERFPLPVFGGRIVLNERDDDDIWMSDQFGVLLELQPLPDAQRPANAGQ